MKKRTLNSVLVSFVALQITENNRVDATDPASVTEVKDECDELEFMLALQQHFANKLNALTSAPAKLTTKLRQLQLAAAKHSGTKLGMQYTLLQAVVEAKPRLAEAAITEGQQKIQSALQAISERIGQLHTMSADAGNPTAQYISAAQDAAAPQLNTGGTNGCKVTFQATKPAMRRCQPDPIKTPKIRQAGSEISKMENIPFTPKNKLLDYSLAVSIQYKGSAAGNTEPTTKNGCGNDNSAGTNGRAITAIAGAPRQLGQDKAALAGDGNCKQPDVDTEVDHFDSARLAYSICEGRKVQSSDPGDIQTQKVENLLSDTVAQQVALRLLRKSATTAPDAGEKAVTELLGAKDTQIQAKFFTPLTKVDTSLKFESAATPISI
uniref:Variant surface glycoprotein 1125.2688 n=1 Tax=Trypanosoma brucei TaxID=5691 RepID=A0A1J0R8P4_9TRYP|nr:variant surface glycoprotein 1125.2688 [Trypanosoma brucei]